MQSRRRLLCLTAHAAVPFLISACGNVPQPFRRVATSSNPLLANPSGAGVGIAPPVGIDRIAASHIAEQIAEHLRQREIPAEAVDRIGILGFTLEGNLWESVENGPETILTFNWRLLNRLGEIVERLYQDVYVETAPWEEGLETELNHVADDIAIRLAVLLAPPLESQTIETPKAPWEGLTATIQKPGSAPGDGSEALGNAMASRLAREGFKPATGAPDVTFAATVNVSQFDAVSDDVAIIWQVLSPDGQSLGEVRLDNRIPRGELDGPWGMIAEAIVDGALPGLLEIIAKTTAPRR
jgi:hypothetical protein